RGHEQPKHDVASRQDEGERTCCCHPWARPARASRVEHLDLFCSQFLLAAHSPLHLTKTPSALQAQSRGLEVYSPRGNRCRVRRERLAEVRNNVRGPCKEEIRKKLPAFGRILRASPSPHGNVNTALIQAICAISAYIAARTASLIGRFRAWAHFMISAQPDIHFTIKQEA